MEHFPDCVAAFEAYRKKKEDFEKKFPLYCRKCGGHGGRVVRYDPSPRGVGLSPGYMEDFDECPDCYAIGICPRCTAALVSDGGEYTDKFGCPTCGWKDDPLGPGLPEQPECWCDERRTFEKDLHDEPV